MESINRVVQRMNAIEQRFRPMTQAVQGDFATALSNATNNKSEPSVARDNSEKVEKMLNVAATKHGVDPRLALAVARTESDLSQDVVSPVGAVGVMQLMPETAQGLGVGNINDARENIDGGVRYLKQMLTTFNGDVTKAVAAYNAGPQAVENYRGVPPYQETKQYVEKVLSLYNR